MTDCWHFLVQLNKRSLSISDRIYSLCLSAHDLCRQGHLVSENSTHLAAHRNQQRPWCVVDLLLFIAAACVEGTREGGQNSGTNTTSEFRFLEPSLTIDLKEVKRVLNIEKCDYSEITTVNSFFQAWDTAPALIFQFLFQNRHDEIADELACLK